MEKEKMTPEEMSKVKGLIKQATTPAELAIMEAWAKALAQGAAIERAKQQGAA